MIEGLSSRRASFPCRPNEQLRHIARLRSKADVVSVGSDRARRDAESGGNLIGCLALRHKVQNAALAR
jgi:hypothetical protein